MADHVPANLDPFWACPRWWRWTLLALSTLILCSCSAPRAQVTGGPHLPEPYVGPAPGQGETPVEPGALDDAPDAVELAALQEPLDRSSPAIDVNAPVPIDPAAPGQALPGPPGVVCPAPGCGPNCGPPGCPCGDCGESPRPLSACGCQWRPPGFGCPWPEDEYLCDGGDENIPVTIGADWSVEGLDAEDTVAHFDTLDGDRVVEPSNKVCIYAPRFAAVRTVTNLNANEHIAGPVGVEQPEQLGRQDEVQIATTRLQTQTPLPQNGLGRATAYVTDVQDGIVAQTLKAKALQDALLPYEDFLIVRQGLYSQAEEARLAEAHDAAITWSHDQAVQVILDEQKAVAETQVEQAETVYTVDTPTGGRLRLIKVASTDTALPGDIIDFTIRFDNVGPAPIGNVTIIDHLTTRLEYMAGSAQSSVEAEFLSEYNRSQSLTLRWEIIQPLEPGQGGLVRFKCRVR
ncbi:MAG: DUF11 domain-containing protein [Pirellulales bacterium]|nr:DUF11 domain-containing protein [Pirellulales bacterium]